MTGRRDRSIATQVADGAPDRFPNAPDPVGQLLLRDGKELLVRLEIREHEDLAGETLPQISGGVIAKGPDHFTKLELHLQG